MDNCIRTKIVGVTYRNEDGSRRQDIISELSTGESLKLVDMATDEFPEAIGVFDLADQQCGFLQKSLAIDLRNSGKSIEDVSVDVLEVTGGNGRSYGCNIRLIIDTDYLCNIVIGDHGSMKIDAPLVDQHDSTEPGVPSFAHTISTLSPGVELYLTKKDDSDCILVLTLDDQCCGYLPPFACENIKKRSQTLDEYIVRVTKVRTTPEPYCKVHIEPGLSAPARKRAIVADKAKKETEKQELDEIKRRAAERLKAKKEAEMQKQDDIMRREQEILKAKNTEQVIPPSSKPSHTDVQKSKSVGCLSSILIVLAAILIIIAVL